MKTKLFFYTLEDHQMHLQKLILTNNLSNKCKFICLRVISENVLNPLKKIKWQNIRIFNIGDEEFCLD